MTWSMRELLGVISRLVKLRVCRSQHGDGIFLMTWGRNIFDEEYRDNTIPIGLWTISYWGAPATYGLDARVSF